MVVSCGRERGRNPSPLLNIIPMMVVVVMVGWGKWCVGIDVDRMEIVRTIVGKKGARY